MTGRCKCFLLSLTFLFVMGADKLIAQEETAAGKYALRIEAASAMQSSFSRCAAYGNIAQQSDLSEEDQVYLVDKLVADPGTSFDKANVLMALLENPAVTQLAKDMIATKLSEMNLSDFDAGRINSALMGDFTPKEQWDGSQSASSDFSFFFTLAVIFYIPVIFYFLTLHKCLTKVKQRNQAMSPGLVWLGLIPLLNVGWNFYIISKLKESLKKEFADRGLEGGGDFGYQIGLAMSILACISVIPLVGFITGLPSIIFWIIYWVKISEYSRKLSLQ